MLPLHLVLDLAKMWAESQTVKKLKAYAEGEARSEGRCRRRSLLALLLGQSEALNRNEQFLCCRRLGNGNGGNKPTVTAVAYLDRGNFTRFIAGHIKPKMKPATEFLTKLALHLIEHLIRLFRRHCAPPPQ
jgi:hypothetical protein